MGRTRRLLKRSRPRFWLYLAGPVFVGAAYGATSVGDLFAPPVVALALYCSAPANLYLYGVNDRFDVDTDAANPKKEDREVRWTGDPLALAAVLAAGLAGVALFAVLPRPAWPWLAGFFALATAYSVPPLRLKARPPLDSLSNGLYVLPGAAAYAALTGTAPPALALLGAWAWTMAMHTFSAIPDVEADRRAGVETTATALGPRRALVYCWCCWVGAAALFALVSPSAGALLAVYPLLVLAIEAGGVAVERAYWWYPAVNAAVGAAFTLGGLWGVVHG